MKALLVFLIIFSVVVVVHEFGHFFFAKRAGILVREFSIGMGPKIFAHRAKDGTTYTIRLLPLGGYVRMAGFEEEEELKAGMPMTILLDSENQVTTINTSKKIQLTDGLPLELVSYDLIDNLTISGYVNGQEEEEQTYLVKPTATIIEEDGTELRIAPRAVRFQSAKLWQRMLTNFAGPMNNFILTFVLFMLYVFLQGGVQDLSSTVISGVNPNSPAQVSGLKANDKIVSINHKNVNNWEEVFNTIQSSKNQLIDVTYLRDHNEHTVQLTPKAIEGKKETSYQIGIKTPLKTSFFDKIKGGISLTLSSFKTIFVALGSLFTDFSLNKLGGPVAIYKMSSEAASQGFLTVIWVMAMISVNLGIFNLLPIPALDGGKLLLNLIEALRGKPLDQDKEGIITMVGIAFMMGLMILVTWNDFQRFFF